MAKNKESKLKSSSITKTTTQTEQNTQKYHKVEFKWPANKEQDWWGANATPSWLEFRSHPSQNMRASERLNSSNETVHEDNKRHIKRQILSSTCIWCNIPLVSIGIWSVGRYKFMNDKYYEGYYQTVSGSQLLRAKVRRRLRIDRACWILVLVSFC